MDDHVHYGFKKITVENWAQPDMPSYFPQVTKDLWLAEITKPQLNAKVPDEICALFECARGLFVYGFLFYPLCMLAAEQFHRVAESATAAKCKAIGLPVQFCNKKGKIQPHSFSDNIGRLIKKGAIAKSQLAWWDSTRKLRNFGSHPERQSLMPPGMLLPIIHRTAEHINHLFK
jgi:hypothetical protein